jgi:hypothetical protein
MELPEHHNDCFLGSEFGWEYLMAKDLSLVFAGQKKCSVTEATEPIVADDVFDALHDAQ